MTVSTKNKYIVAFAATAVLAVGLYGCGGGGGGGGGPTTTMPTTYDVDLFSNVTPGFTAEAGTVQVAEGQSEAHGDIQFTCPAGSGGCEVMVMVDANGAISATSTGGMVTAMNASGYNTRIRVTNEANSIHAETGIDLLEGNDPLLPSVTYFPDSGSNYLSLYSHVSTLAHYNARFARAIPWVNRLGQVNFEFGFNSGLSASELHPLAWLGRSFSTTNVAQYSEDTSHVLGSDWRVFKARNDYDGAGKLTISVATDVHNAGTTEEPFVGYGDFDRKIELSDIPPLPADRDWQGVNVVGGAKGSIDGVSGIFTCYSGVSACYLEIGRNGDAEGYYPYEDVVFTRNDNGTSELLYPVYGDVLPDADYMVFGTWQYVPDNISANDDYEFGALASGGDPFRSSNAAADLYGTATYNGRAQGMYYTDRSSMTPSVGSFDASVTLEADFGNMADTLDEGRLSGTVQNIRYDGVALGFPAQLTLEGEHDPQAHLLAPAFFYSDESLTAAGVVSDGEPTPSWFGTWQAAFFGNSANPNDHPTGIAGTFGATNDEDGLVGAFGARVRPPPPPS